MKSVQENGINAMKKNLDNEQKAVEQTAEQAGEQIIEQTKTKAKAKFSVAKRILTAIVALLVVAFAAGIIWVNDYYHADNVYSQVKQVAKSEGISVSQNDSSITMKNNGSTLEVKNSSHRKIGIIFYPGAKVDPHAYMPLMLRLTEEGYTTVIAKMPANLAVLKSSAATQIIVSNPQIKSWWLSGHSMGGAMIGSYAAKSHNAKIKGLIFLAAYSTSDLSTTNLKVLTIYGSKDGVLNREHLKKYSSNLPKNSKITIIRGGNHAQFGNYGMQKGDGIAKISRSKQQAITARSILKFIG